MIWLHCGSADEIESTLSIAARIADLGDDAGVLITADESFVERLNDHETMATIQSAPQDTPAKATEFLEAWRPEYLIWNGGPVRPALMRLVGKARVAATMINARNAGLISGGTRFLPGALKAAVSPFRRILTVDGATATRLTRGGVPRDAVAAIGPILEEPVTLPHDQNELAVMAEAIDTRPMWLAACLAPGEVTAVAEAHLAAMRKSHRLLLILAPSDLDDGPQVAETLRGAGLKVGLRSDGDDPEPEDQVYIADLEGELGLWYRVAPLTFIGGTLNGEGAAVSPFDPIALGSAVIHGRHTAPHDARFARLALAEACREVRTAQQLGIAVSSLTAPEQAARMALAGWEELSRSASTLNQLIADALDHSMVSQ